jgi:hypothetical protein
VGLKVLFGEKVIKEMEKGDEWSLHILLMEERRGKELRSKVIKASHKESLR